MLLWGYLDDYGRGIDSTKAIAGDCFPWDEKISPATIDRWLRIMTTKVDGEPGPVCRYTVAGKPYLHAVNWKEHQRPNRPTDSRLPQCPVHEGLSESLTEERNEPVTEPLHVGAAAGSSSGEVEQQQGPRESRGEPPRSAAIGLLLTWLEAEACTAEEAADIAEQVKRERKPRNLAGLLHTIAMAGELPELLEAVRTDRRRIAVGNALAAARDGPECDHGVPGGASPHPTTGKPLCPNCRSERLGAA